jgi:CheY-like chemotaxis protein
MDQREPVVLVVDDDHSVLHVTEIILRRKGYSPIASSGPLEALEKSRNFLGGIDLLLTDVAMPEMDGLSLAEKILAERPQTRVLLMSGFAAVQSRLPLLTKPFSSKNLIEQVSIVIDGPSTPPSDVSADKRFWRGIMQARLGTPSQAALHRFLEASRNLLEATAEIPSGIPSPDGHVRIQNLGKEAKKAFDAYQGTLKKLDHSAAKDESEGE